MLFGVLSVVAGVIALIDPGSQPARDRHPVRHLPDRRRHLRALAGVTAREADTIRRVFAVVLGILSLIAGVICLLRPGAGIFALVIVVGVFLVMAGVIQLAGAVSDDTPWLPRRVGLVDLVLGIIILAVPGSA